MIYNDQTQQWEKAPEPVDIPAPGKGESTEKQERLRRLSSSRGALRPKEKSHRPRKGVLPVDRRL